MRQHFEQVTAAWARYWFEEIPPHSFALLRITFGALVIVSLFGVTPVDTFWALDGLSPLPGPDGIRAWAVNHGLSVVAGRAFFAIFLAAAVAMLVGFRSDAAVLLTLVCGLLQVKWNRLPLSSAHQIATVVLFMLAWTHTGRVWALDAVRRGPEGVESKSWFVPIWPLRLIRYQVSLIYFSSALSKMVFPTWRDGSASHWALTLNNFHRFPWPLPPTADFVVPFLTWSTLLFELLFPVLVWFRATRGPTLVAGIGLHLGLALTLEVGPFTPLMIASYIAFLDPRTVARFDPSQRHVASARADMPRLEGQDAT